MGSERAGGMGETPHDEAATGRHGEERSNPSPEGGGAQGPTPWGVVFRRSPVATLLATGLGSGFSPFAPGTAGSLLGLAITELLVAASGTLAAWLFAVASAVVGIWAAGRAAAGRGVEDPGEVVIDEVAGQAIALAMLHSALPAAARAGPTWGLVFAAFFLFRLLDVVKPGPVGRLEELPGGLGVMADDLLAGAIAGAVVAGAALAL